MEQEAIEPIGSVRRKKRLVVTGLETGVPEPHQFQKLIFESQTKVNACALDNLKEVRRAHDAASSLQDRRLTQVRQEQKQAWLQLAMLSPLRAHAASHDWKRLG